MQRRGHQVKGHKGKKQSGEFKGKGFKKSHRGPKDESDREEEEARVERVELENRAQGHHFEAFASSSDENEEVENEVEREIDQEDDAAVPFEFQINGEFFKTLLKDLKLYDLRLSKLSSLKQSESLTEEGQEFINQYHSLVTLYCLYLMHYTYLTSQGGTSFHPVLRMLAGLKEKVKVLDKEFAKHKDTVNQLLDNLPVQDEQDDGEEESIDEKMDEEEYEGDSEGFEEEESPKARLHVSKNKDESARKPNAKRDKPKRKVQVFKLDQGKSYADVHHYVPDDEEEDDGVLNLNSKAIAGEEIVGEITMDDFNAFNSAKSLPNKPKKPSKKGMQLYEELSSKKAQAKSLSNALREEAEAALDEFERKLMFNDRKVKADQPRNLSEDMLLNRGLKQKRSNQISKVKLRRKYEKAKLQDRVRKGIRLEDGRNRDIHMIKSVGEGAVRDISLN
jgi:hypothetical protein